MSLDPESFREKFGPWYNSFVPFLVSEECEKIYTYLKNRSIEYKSKIFPRSDYTFRAFAKTNPNNINCIIIGQSPYHTISKAGIPHADGIAFSNKFANEIPPSLEKFYDAMDKDLDTKVQRVSNLDYLCEQGVLLLNASFTTEYKKSSIHEDIGLWDSFNKYLYKEVLSSFTGIPVITMGSSAKTISKYIFPMANPILNIEHPAAAAYGGRDWENKRCFSWANKIIGENNGWDKVIIWDYASYNDLPF